jgi:RNase P/RNase MRP subunit POP5
LVFEIISKSRINDFNAVSEQITAKSLEMIGQLGVARAGIQPLADCWNARLQRGIIKVGHRYTDELKASLAFIQKVNNEGVIFKSIGMSGILDKAKQKYLEG